MKDRYTKRVEELVHELRHMLDTIEKALAIGDGRAALDGAHGVSHVARQLIIATLSLHRGITDV